MSLTALAAQKAKSKEKPYKLSDSKGLYLFVHPAGGKYWRMKYYHLGKEKHMSLGVYPEVSLSDARDAVIEARKLIKQNIDPNAKKQEERKIAEYKAKNTFKLIAEDWFNTTSEEWTPAHAKKVWRRIEVHLLPTFAQRPIDSIDTLEIIALLREIEAKGHGEMARKVLQVLRAVFRHALHLKKVKLNPAADLTPILKKQKKKNYPTIFITELPDFLTKLDTQNSHPQIKLAIKLLMLTFVRQGEMRKSKWDYINWEKKQWVLPAEIMKMKKEHTVPLSEQAMAVLRELYALTGNDVSGYILPSLKRQGNAMMSDGTINKCIKEMGYKDRMVAHGFRSLASTTLNEQQKYSPDVIERQLAHREKNDVRAAYNRAEYMPERTAMMQEWADYIDEICAGGEVVNIRFGRK